MTASVFMTHPRGHIKKRSSSRGRTEPNMVTGAEDKKQTENKNLYQKRNRQYTKIIIIIIIDVFRKFMHIKKRELK